MGMASALRTKLTDPVGKFDDYLVTKKNQLNRLMMLTSGGRLNL